MNYLHQNFSHYLLAGYEPWYNIQCKASTPSRDIADIS